MNESLATADGRLTTLSLARLNDDELERIHLQLFFENEVMPGELGGTIAYRALSMLASRLARERQEAGDPAAEVQAARGLNRLRQRVASRYASIEHRDSRDLAWLVEAYRRLTGRGIHPRELEQWLVGMRAGPLDREAVTSALQQVADDEQRALEVPRDSGSCWIMGTAQTIGPEDWRSRARELDCAPSIELERGASAVRGKRDVSATPASGSTRLRPGGSPQCLVSVIASVYEGGRFIETFMDNVCSQTIFRDWCELIVVDAASPEGEGDVIRRWMADFPNIRYIRTPERIGIYQAWNLGIREARGELLTNANVDDLRRHDSFEIQAATLQALPEVDVVYQDVYYTLEPCLPFERVAAFGFRSRVPRVTPAVMLSFNPPHNAPMWRRRLHDELGLFDTRYRSAGDYEFWLRCSAAGKVFHRVADPHVVYYQNPQGYSTRADTTGHSETRELTAQYGLRLLGLDASRDTPGGVGRTASARAARHCDRLSVHVAGCVVPPAAC